MIMLVAYFSLVFLWDPTYYVLLLHLDFNKARVLRREGDENTLQVMPSGVAMVEGVIGYWEIPKWDHVLPMFKCLDTLRRGTC